MGPRRTGKDRVKLYREGFMVRHSFAWKIAIGIPLGYLAIPWIASEASMTFWATAVNKGCLPKPQE